MDWLTKTNVQGRSPGSAGVAVAVCHLRQSSAMRHSICSDKHEGFRGSGDNGGSGRLHLRPLRGYSQTGRPLPIAGGLVYVGTGSDPRSKPGRASRQRIFGGLTQPCRKSRQLLATPAVRSRTRSAHLRRAQLEATYEPSEIAALNKASDFLDQAPDCGSGPSDWPRMPGWRVPAQ
jgi:hypothetical protein